MVTPGPDLYKRLWGTEDALEIYRKFFEDEQSANLEDFLWASDHELFAVDEGSLFFVAQAIRRDAAAAAVRQAKLIPGKRCGAPIRTVVYDEEEDLYIVTDPLKESAWFYMASHTPEEVAAHLLLIFEEWEPV